MTVSYMFTTADIGAAFVSEPRRLGIHASNTPSDPPLHCSPVISYTSYLSFHVLIPSDSPSSSISHTLLLSRIPRTTF
jgi:hypothetical protein